MNTNCVNQPTTIGITTRLRIRTTQPKTILIASTIASTMATALRKEDELIWTAFLQSFDTRYSSIRPLSYQLLDEENNMLRRKVEEMKKQVADLTAANEVLLEQNARYRVSKSNHVQTINVPVSQALSVGQTLASAGVATAGVAPTPSQQQLNHINNSLAQQMAMNNDLVSQHAMQQRLARRTTWPTSCAVQLTYSVIEPFSYN